eukprot:17311_1
MINIRKTKKYLFSLTRSHSSTMSKPKQSCKFPNLSKLLSSKSKSSNDFIIKHSQRNNIKEPSDITSVDLRRVVFVSLHGLSGTWEQCPSFVLYSAIFILPLKRHWLYFLSEYRKKEPSRLEPELNIFLSLSKNDDDLIELLTWKDSQGLLFFGLDEYDHEQKHADSESLVHPFWRHVSTQLSDLYDPVTQNKYSALQLDDKYWTNSSLWNNRYEVKTSQVLTELYFATLKFKTMQEIIYQSNPNTLLPIRFHHADVYRSFTRYAIASDSSVKYSRNKPQIGKQNNSEWWMASDYLFE